MAEAYYTMKQAHDYIHHIIKALDTYKEHEQYNVRQIQSIIVISGNYVNFKQCENHSYI